MLALTLIIILGVAYLFRNHFKRRPPGPTRLPLIGNLHQLRKWSRSEPHTHIMLQNFSQRYGPISSLQFGLLEQVVIDDANLIREILSSDNWGQRPLNTYVLERSYGKPLGLLWSRGEANKELRRFSLRTLRDFGFGRAKSQDAVMTEELQELMSRLDVKLAQDGDTICMSQFFNISVLNIIWSMVAGERFGHEDANFNELVTKVNQTLRLVTATGNVMMGYPFLTHILPWLTGYGRVRKRCIPQMQGLFMNILKERRQSGHYKTDQKDFIDVFMAEIDKHRGTSLSSTYSDQQFVMSVLDLFVAGSETTSNSLEYSILLMILNPEVQNKVRAEIDEIVGRQKIANFSDKQEMPYTEATLLEILRVSSVVPLIVRAPLEPTVLGGYKIPKETYTILNTYSAHHDPKLWPDPGRFSPERFLDGDKVVNSEKLIPFGLGKRYCLGEVLARASLFTYFVTMLQNYTFSKSLEHPTPSLKGVPGITLSPQRFYAVIKKRE